MSTLYSHLSVSASSARSLVERTQHDFVDVGETISKVGVPTRLDFPVVESYRTTCFSARLDVQYTKR